MFNAAALTTDGTNQRDNINAYNVARINSWICWGFDSLYAHRKPLLLYAFAFNLAAIACITIACLAISTSSRLTSVGWASATMTLENLSQCPNDSASVTIHAWLGLKGYYGQCIGEYLNEGKSSSTVTGQHGDTFCSTKSNSTFIETSFNKNMCTRSELNCELFTNVVLDVRNESIITTTHPSCSACKDTSRDCVGTLVSAAAFGVFPLVLTIRRYVSHKRERGLRLRTLFFSLTAMVLGLHAFVTFHTECVNRGMPSAFSVLICDYRCNNGQPFFVSVPMRFELDTGGKLVIVAAVLKFSYFVLHFVTPVAKTTYTRIPDLTRRESSKNPE